MPRKKKSQAPEGYNPSAHWIIETTIKVNGRTVEPGTEVHLHGEEGRFTFRRQVTNPANGAVWIDVFGGARKHEQLRSFRPDRIKTVHRLVKRRPSKQTEKKVKKA